MSRILLIGSEKYPIPIFRALIESEYAEVVGLITSPYTGENPQDVYKVLKETYIPIFQPENINEEANQILAKTKPDLILVCNYGQFLGEYILNYPKFKCLNVHFSLLPQLRGACPIEMAILQGLKRSGITIQIMEKELDVGDILFQEELTLEENETGDTLMKKMQEVTSENIEKVVLDWINAKIKPKSQDHSKATYCYREDISKEKARINWENSADKIDRKIRAFNPRVIAWTMLEGKRLKIFEASKSNEELNLKTGKCMVKGTRLKVQTGKGIILPEVVQLEGKNEMSIQEFLQGFRKDIVFV
jgi:methionyl-tRNA formyltransferase